MNVAAEVGEAGGSGQNTPAGGGLKIIDLGLMKYREAWDLQQRWHERVLAGEFPPGVLLLLEHPPVITIGRRPGAAGHLLAAAEILFQRGVETVETDRGGDITFHGPGQLVAYPILPLNFYGLNLHGYMRLLEQVVIDTLENFGVTGERLAGATGVWVGDSGGGPAKICAIGIKLRRWVSLHGLALNVSTDLSFFDLINPCGLGRPVISMAKLFGGNGPEMGRVKNAIAREFERQLAGMATRKTT